MLALADISAMETTGWKERLAAAIEADSRSDRALSMESGNGKGYVHSILKEGKDPSVTNLTRLCDTLGVSLTHILYGFDITPETEKLLRAVGQHPETLPHLLAILEAKETGET